jgi:hypothetical protein
MYAVNLADWMGHSDDVGLGIILKPVIQSKQIVETERKRFDGMGILLECDEARGEAIVAIIRQRYKKHELRLYKGKSKTWKRV